MHQMVKPCYTDVDPPIKAHCFCLFRLQREYWSAWEKKKPTHSQMLQFAKGLWVAGIHRCAVKTLSWILQKHVHLNKQAAGAKCPSWEALKCCFFFFFCSGWAYIMIQMKMIRMCLIVIIRWKSLHPTVLENMGLFSPSQMDLNAPLMEGSRCDIKRHIWWGCEGHSARYSYFLLDLFKERHCWQAVGDLTAHLTPTRRA